MGGPRCPEGVLQRVRGQTQVGHEIGVEAGGAVGGLLGGHAQIPGDVGQVAMEEEGAVEQEETAFAALGVARELPVAEHQVRVAGDAHGRREQRLQGRALALHDELVRAADGMERAALALREDQGVIEAARALEHGAAAAAPAVNRHAVRRACGQIGLRGGAVGVAEHHEPADRLPKAQEAGQPAGFGQVEEGFVRREVGRWRPLGLVEVFHCQNLSRV